MGSILKAICKCGFESEEIFAGGGFQNFRTTCNAPAICLKCGKLLVGNYLEEHEKCPDCGENITFYDDPKLQTQKNSSKKLTNIFYWHLGDEKGDFELPNTRYLCPKCGKMTLVFILIGNWD